MIQHVCLGGQLENVLVFGRGDFISVLERN